MSLINKMLRDLESRQDGGDTRDPRVVYEDLQASRAARGPGNGRLPVKAIALVGGVAVLAVIVFGWLSGQPQPAPVPVAVVTPPPVTVAQPVAAAPEIKPVEPAKPAKPAAKPPVARPKPPVRARETPLMALPPSVPVQRVRQVAQKPATTATPVARPGQMEKVVKPLTAPEQAEAAHREAANLLQQGRGNEAEDKLRAAIGFQASHAPARELLIGLLLQRGARDEARQQLEAGISQSPNHLSFYRLLARLHVDAGQEARALALLESANPRATNDIEHQRFLAALYQRAGRHADAVKAYRQAVTLRPYDGRAWLGLGISLEALEHWKEAATAYQRALAGNGLDERLSDYARQRQALMKEKP